MNANSWFEKHYTRKQGVGMLATDKGDRRAHVINEVHCEQEGPYYNDLLYRKERFAYSPDVLLIRSERYSGAGLEHHKVDWSVKSPGPYLQACMAKIAYMVSLCSADEIFCAMQVLGLDEPEEAYCEGGNK